MHMSMASPFTRPSPNDRRVGIRIGTFEACSGFTRVTARRIAQPPKATFVARLQPCRLPDKAARQLPDLSTTVWVEPSSTGDSRLRGARPSSDISSLTGPIEFASANGETTNQLIDTPSLVAEATKPSFVGLHSLACGTFASHSTFYESIICRSPHPGSRV